MHSSRMRTGRALTVSGGGGWRVCIPEEIFWGENKLKKKRKKNFRTPPENLGQTPPPPKIWVRHPPPRVDRQTPVNLLPWPNFVAAGNYIMNCQVRLVEIPKCHQGVSFCIGCPPRYNISISFTKCLKI